MKRVTITVLFITPLRVRHPKHFEEHLPKCFSVHIHMCIVVHNFKQIELYVLFHNLLLNQGVTQIFPSPWILIHIICHRVTYYSHICLNHSLFNQFCINGFSDCVQDLFKKEILQWTFSYLLQILLLILWEMIGKFLLSVGNLWTHPSNNFSFPLESRIDRHWPLPMILCNYCKGVCCPL